jgi:hypothetical protein
MIENVNYHWSWQGLNTIVQWDAPGGPVYQCGECYARSLTATAPSLPMSSPPRVPPPLGTKCQCGRAVA